MTGTAVKAGGNCQLTLTGVNLTAGVGIDAGGNAKVVMTGGAITATTNSLVAGANAHVDCVGTKVTGKSKASAAGKITGANLRLAGGLFRARRRLWATKRTLCTNMSYLTSTGYNGMHAHLVVRRIETTDRP